MKEPALARWRQRPSPLARHALVCYTLLILYGCLYPFTGWTALGIGPFSYLDAPLPQYLTPFDVGVNIAGYLPLGALLVLAQYPRRTGWRAAMLASVLAILLSAGIEALQTYLPTRVASNLDLAANALGAFLGAVLAVPASAPLLERGVLRRLRLQWFERHTGALLALVALWPFAQMYPQPFLFGDGDWPRVLWSMLDPNLRDLLLARTAALADLPPAIGALQDSSVWEAWVAALGLAGAGLLFSLAVRPDAPRLRLTLGFVVLSLGIKLLANDLQSSGQALDWLTAGALYGIAAGALALVVLTHVPYGWRAALASAALLLALLLANLLPLNPYFDVILAGWREGRYRHFNDLARWLAWAWPYAALSWLCISAEQAWLARRARRARARARGRSRLSL